MYIPLSDRSSRAWKVVRWGRRNPGLVAGSEKDGPQGGVWSRCRGYRPTLAGRTFLVFGQAVPTVTLVCGPVSYRRRLRRIPRFVRVSRLGRHSPRVPMQCCWVQRLPRFCRRRSARGGVSPPSPAFAAPPSRARRARAMTRAWTRKAMRRTVPGAAGRPEARTPPRNLSRRRKSGGSRRRKGWSEKPPPSRCGSTLCPENRRKEKAVAGKRRVSSSACPVSHLFCLAMLPSRYPPPLPSARRGDASASALKPRRSKTRITRKTMARTRLPLPSRRIPRVS